jgi:hypothetical protein
MTDETPAAPRILITSRGERRTLIRKQGRPTLYSDAIASRICNHLETGTVLEHAARAEGVDSPTVRNWLYDNPRFARAVAMASSKAHVAMSESVFTAGKTDWKAALEWLKRRDRANWGDTLDLRSIDAETLLRMYTSQRQTTVNANEETLELGDSDL